MSEPTPESGAADAPDAQARAAAEALADRLSRLGRHIQEKNAQAVRGVSVSYGELSVDAHAVPILRLMEFLRDDSLCSFGTLIDLCGVDYPGRTPRFEVVYHLLSLGQNQRLRVRVATDDVTPVPSVVPVWSAAGWYEREAWDMYGILFSDHPDLRRLLCDYGFEGHPLRKDFPMTGYREVRYDPRVGRVVYQPVQLQQAWRDFDFTSPWEGMDHLLPGDEKAGPSGD